VPEFPTLNIAGKVAEDLSLMRKIDAVFDRRGVFARRVDDHVGGARRRRHDAPADLHHRDDDGHEQQQHPEASCRGDLLVLARGAGEDRVHRAAPGWLWEGVWSSPPTRWMKTSCRLGLCFSKPRSAKPCEVQDSSSAPGSAPGDSFTFHFGQPPLPASV